MTDVFNPVEELRRHGLCGNSVPAETEQILGTLTPSQVDVFVRVQQRVGASHLDSPSRNADDTGLALAMTRAMGWNRPSIRQIDAEVEGMSTAVAPAECACLCTGGGGGSGSAA